jgi:hypothetical protein
MSVSLELGVRPSDDWTAEATYFTLDVFDHEDTGRREIDAFRYRRYLALGWIRETETRPYYQLTTNGEKIYWKFYWPVAKQAGWAWE